MFHFLLFERVLALLCTPLNSSPGSERLPRHYGQFCAVAHKQNPKLPGQFVRLSPLGRYPNRSGCRMQNQPLRNAYLPIPDSVLAARVSTSTLERCSEVNHGGSPGGDFRCLHNAVGDCLDPSIVEFPPEPNGHIGETFVSEAGPIIAAIHSQGLVSLPRLPDLLSPGPLFLEGKNDSGLEAPDCSHLSIAPFPVL